MMIGERVSVTMISNHAGTAWYGMVRRYALWVWPMTTYACSHPTEDVCLEDVFNVVNSLRKERDAIKR